MPLSKTPPLEPLTMTVVVPCPGPKAFSIFVAKMDSWWPMAKYTVSGMKGGAGAKAIRVQAQKGGVIIEVGPDNEEHKWGSFVSFNPSTDLSMEFHIPNPGEKVMGRSLVELTFNDLGDGRARVDLSQSNWQAFGDNAFGLRATYLSSWKTILGDAFKSACGRKA